jgi:hypothetical protein
VADAIAQPTADYVGIRSKVVGQRAIGPAAAIFEHLRQIPVVQGEPGLNVRLEQPIDQLLVPVQASCVRLAGARRQDARPGN